VEAAARLEEAASSKNPTKEVEAAVAVVDYIDY
jgi:hypothetical protein